MVRAKGSPGEGVRTFKPNGAPRKSWEGVPTGSEMDPRLKTARWRKAREAVLNDEPVCPICLEAGSITPAVEVDHIVPRSHDWEAFTDRLNLWGLCRPCHQTKTLLERVGAVHLTRPEWVDHVLKRQRRRPFTL